MEETSEKIYLFKKRDELGRKIVKIIDEKGLTKNCDIEALEEHKEFVKVEEELKKLFLTKQEQESK